jgi:molybdopterin synthase sulfur carrier subunit
MPHVHIPALLRSATDNRDWVEAPGGTVREVVAALEAAYPGLEDKLVRDGRLLPGLAVAIDGEISSIGLNEATEPDTEVQFITAIQGG